MKRSRSLVAYDSSEDEGDRPRLSLCCPPPKKRKLPSLAPSLVPKVPVDNPALHQGRVRATPHVEGQYAAYVYVPLAVERGSSLHKILLDVYASAKNKVPSLHPLGFELAGVASEHPQPCELHVSLTRPTFLRAHQREDFRRAVQAAAKSRPCFTASFATFAELTNDERTRTFLSLEVGAGHAEFKTMSDALAPTLRVLRQKEFYDDPRFHASIAWSLLDPHAGSSAQNVPRSGSPSELFASDPPTPGPQASLSTPPVPATAVDVLGTSAQFCTIPHFPPTLVADIRQDFGSMLASRRAGTFSVEELAVRIGKDVSKWRLAG